ncbi:aminotransferase class I/II-fold pyridoxal phosphate-dependent enzyme [Streptomyces sp. SJL17-1]|uniref:aminotransferase class I/II-fold pyridoxal phosphate-dependent enzyme n=1 Tax=Streptomyces sp. SJL17-1 TaxID=2967223 RepID=UPI002966B701|nr:aminotransferase class I/II-fold pyridoxal phosphate-dependent enzyme [Streptomyces sp. SJL17-1]
MDPAVPPDPGRADGRLPGVPRPAHRPVGAHRPRRRRRDPRRRPPPQAGPALALAGARRRQPRLRGRRHRVQRPGGLLRPDQAVPLRRRRPVPGHLPPVRHRPVRLHPLPGRRPRPRRRPRRADPHLGPRAALLGQPHHPAGQERGHELGREGHLHRLSPRRRAHARDARPAARARRPQIPVRAAPHPRHLRHPRLRRHLRHAPTARHLAGRHPLGPRLGRLLHRLGPRRPPPLDDRPHRARPRTRAARGRATARPARGRLARRPRPAAAPVAAGRPGQGHRRHRRHRGLLGPDVPAGPRPALGHDERPRQGRGARTEPPDSRRLPGRRPEPPRGRRSRGDGVRDPLRARHRAPGPAVHPGPPGRPERRGHGRPPLELPHGRTDPAPGLTAPDAEPADATFVRLRPPAVRREPPRERAERAPHPLRRRSGRSPRRSAPACHRPAPPDPRDRLARERLRRHPAPPRLPARPRRRRGTRPRALRPALPPGTPGTGGSRTAARRAAPRRPREEARGDLRPGPVPRLPGGPRPRTLRPQRGGQPPHQRGLLPYPRAQHLGRHPHRRRRQRPVREPLRRVHVRPLPAPRHPPHRPRRPRRHGRRPARPGRRPHPRRRRRPGRLEAPPRRLGRPGGRGPLQQPPRRAHRARPRPHPPRRDRTAETGTRTDPPGLPRLAHRASQPRPAPGTGRTGPAQGPPRIHPYLHALRRPRRLQGRQRHHGALRRRRTPRRRRPPPHLRAAAHRHRGPPRRRRVRRPHRGRARAPRRRDPRGGDRAHPEPALPPHRRSGLRVDQRRRRDRPRQRPRRGTPRPRRPRPVRGQGGRQEALAALPPRVPLAARRPARTPGRHGHGHRRPRVRPAVPADRRGTGRRTGRPRSAHPLAARPPGHGPAGPVHRPGRGERPHHAARRLGPRTGRAGHRPLAARPPPQGPAVRQRQRLRPPVPGPRIPRRRTPHPPLLGARARLPRPGAHRDRPDAQGRPDQDHHGRPEGAGRLHRHRRLRHRFLLAQLPPRVPIDVLKVDKSFIDNITTDPQQVALVEGIVRIADVLGLQVVAEGIEHEEQRALLAEMGCRYGQGYLFARPMTAHQAEFYLHRAPSSGERPPARPAVRPAARVGHPPRASRWRDLEHLHRTSRMCDAVIDEVDGRRIRVGDDWLIDFASCNYLGLDLDPTAIEAIEPEVRRWGTHPSWSRLIGSPRLYPRIEERLTELLGASDTLLLPTVTLIHQSVIPLLAGTGQVFVEAQAHRTVYDGCVAARGQGAEIHRFHAERPDELEALLRGAPGDASRLICMDGVNSMTGNFPDFPTLARVSRENGALLYIDDAHGFGVIGERRPGETSPYGSRGNSIVRHLGETYDDLVLVGGFSKAFSSLLAFLAVPKWLKDHLKVAAAPYLYSGPSPTASLATALAGLDVNDARGDEIRAGLYRKTARVLDHVRALGIATPNTDGLPIVEIPLADADDLDAVAAFLWEHGIYVTLASYPLVPRDRVGFRVQITAANTDEEIGELRVALTELAERFSLQSADAARPSVVTGGRTAEP